jgi:Lon-like protease
MHPATTTRLIKVLTADGSLPSDPEVTGNDDLPPVEPPPRRSRRWWVLGPLLFVLVAALLLAVFLPIPYYTISPGQIRSAATSVSIDGESFPPEGGEVSYATVSIQQVTALGALTGWLDPTTEVRPEDEVLIGGNRDDNAEVNAQLMDDSKTNAEVAAFAALGCDVLAGTGAVVAGIEPGLPAEDALEVGDTIVAVDGEPIEVGADLGQAIDGHEVGDTLLFDVEAEDGTTRQVEISLADRPTEPGDPVIGVALGTRDLEIDLPLDVAIDSGEVGGPSAGLAFTLALLDQLTPGSLTGGQDVTATGTMDVRGDVGPVGGVPQKTAAVRRAGDDLFLVPPQELEEAEAAAGDDLEVVAVATLDEALAALEARGGDVSAVEDSEICGAE